MSAVKPITTAAQPGGKGGREIAPFTKADVFRRSKLNELVSKLNPLQFISISWGQEDKIIYSESNVHLQLNRNEGGGVGGNGSAVKMTITAINANTVTCTDEGGHTGLLVAKPPLLRESNSSRVVDGSTVSYSSYSTANQTRTASVTIGGNTMTQTQVVSPRYKVDDVIYAVAATTDVTNADYLDLNVDGRVYARKFTG